MSLTTKVMSAAVLPGFLSPSSGKVIRVPAFQPGFTAISISFSSIRLEPTPSLIVLLIFNFFVHPTLSSSRESSSGFSIVWSFGGDEAAVEGKELAPSERGRLGAEKGESDLPGKALLGFRFPPF